MLASSGSSLKRSPFAAYPLLFPLVEQSNKDIKKKPWINRAFSRSQLRMLIMDSLNCQFSMVAEARYQPVPLCPRHPSLMEDPSASALQPPAHQEKI